MPSSSAASCRSAITAPVPHSCAPVTMTPDPSALIFTYAPDAPGNDGHQPTAMPIASSSGSSAVS